MWILIHWNSVEDIVDEYHIHIYDSFTITIQIIDTNIVQSSDVSAIQASHIGISTVFLSLSN